MSKEEERLALICDYKTVAKTDAGISVFNDLSRVCHENANPYIKESFDGTAFNCGVLSVIQYIRRMLSSDGEPRQTEAKTERTEQ
jgi:hypothetical protein